MKLDVRLTACAEFVDKDSFVADIGTDHAFLPVYLVKNGISIGAVAGDIGIGPLNSARKTVEKHNLMDKISLCLSDGLKNIPKDKISHIVIAGMGGETIKGILSACDWAKDCKLILQPMTKSEILVSWLYNNGFEIEKERAILDGKFIYIVLKCRYTSKIKDPTPLECIIGNLDLKDENSKAYINNKISLLEKSSRAKSRTLEHCKEAEEEMLLCEKLRSLINDC